MARLYSSLSGGELFEQITAEGYIMSEAEVINYMRQICEGVKHMHERNIIHLGKEKLLVQAMIKIPPFRYQAGKRHVPNVQEYQHQDH